MHIPPLTTMATGPVFAGIEGQRPRGLRLRPTGVVSWTAFADDSRHVEAPGPATCAPAQASPTAAGGAGWSARAAVAGLLEHPLGEGLDEQFRLARFLDETRVDIHAHDVPIGISADDHAAGLGSSLADPAKYLEA